MSISPVKERERHERQEAILKLLAENGPMASIDVAKKLRIDSRGLLNVLARMQNENLIERRLLKWTPRYRRGLVLCWLPGASAEAIKALEERLATEKPSQAYRFCLPRTG